MAVKRNFWRGRRTLVTGGGGLLGRWLAKRLVDAGADVVCLIRNRAVEGIKADRAKLVRGDIRDRLVIERILAEYEVNTVFHAAAQAVVAVANRDPAPTFEANIEGTWNVLEACRRTPAVKSIIVTSSDKAYGEQKKLPYTESTPLEGRNPYDASKACADLIAQTYGKAYQLPVAITRCGNFFGGGDLNWNRIVPSTIRSVVHGERPVIRSDGHFVRDYIYVEDGAAAHMLLAEKLAANGDLRGSAFNFSYELKLDVIDLVKKILRKMKSKLQPEIRNEVSNEIREQYLSSRRAREVLGWAPLFTLDQGLDRTIRWYTEYLK